MISWNYNPEIAKDKDVNTFYFKNSSGNMNDALYRGVYR